MPALRPAALALVALAAAPAVSAADAPGAVAAGEPLVTVQPPPGAVVAPPGDLAVAAGARDQPVTVIYVYPTSPSIFVPVAGLPSFVVQPGAPLPEVSMYVVHAVPLPAFPVAAAVPAGDLDCANFAGTVRIVPPDVHGLDRDGDGLGCEPEDR